LSSHVAANKQSRTLLRAYLPKTAKGVGPTALAWLNVFYLLLHIKDIYITTSIITEGMTLPTSSSLKAVVFLFGILTWQQLISTRLVLNKPTLPAFGI